MVTPKYDMWAIINMDYDRRQNHFEMKNKNQESVKRGISYLWSQHLAEVGGLLCIWSKPRTEVLSNKIKQQQNNY